MIVYHGSHTEVKFPDSLYGRFNLDFGQGFYVTTLQKHAEKWAIRKSRRRQGSPTISVFNFDISGLDILAFGGYTEDWLDFVISNRIGKPELHQHDAIFGNIADDDVAGVVDEYIRLLSKNRVTPEIKTAWLQLLQYSEPNNQYCIISQKAIKAIKFRESYVL